MTATEAEKSKPLILAIDDDYMIRMVTARILGDEAEVKCVISGEDGLAFLANRPADLVLLDYEMPDMNGLSVLKKIKSDDKLKDIPVIMMTGGIEGRANMELETKALELGAADFLNKPLFPPVTLHRVRNVLNYQHLQRHLEEEVEKQTQRAEKNLAASQRLFEETVLALSKSIDAKDSYTRGHSQRVAEYSAEISRRYGDTPERQKQIFQMGLLHDIGKIGIPGAIINKPGRLTDEEFAIIRSHTVIGADILKPIKEFPELGTGARYHHERYDGRGYPDGIAGEDIPLAARMIAVADSYDAMTSKRSYRDSMPQQKVRDEIVKGRGTQFDPQFADIMLQMIDEDKEYTMRDSGIPTEDKENGE